ncbi:chymotrypsin-1-like [Nymphalis io]|uniref:chymotrypsin-1-like n=1 Tax=Inachis io TaxID=171585 RepID=UPI00216A2012|nr:chymotrypsin-1-like [Nymphalis io]
MSEKRAVLEALEAGEIGAASEGGSTTGLLLGIQADLVTANDTLITATGRDFREAARLAEVGRTLTVDRVEMLGLSFSISKTEALLFHAFPAQEQDMSIFFDHTDPSARILGGSAAGRVPYIVALSSGISVRNFVCGGSLVTNRHVLTAAHCIRAVFSGGNLLGSLRGTVGTNRWNTGGTRYQFARNITHPHYVHSIIKNDIGILVTTTNVVMSNTVARVNLNYDFVGAGVATTVTGWGRTSTGGSISQVLMQLSATVIDGNRCVTDVRNRAAQLNIRNAPAVQPHIEICTFHSNGRGTCNGDSGSPLMRADSQQQIGVVSWGLPCARGAPDMFVRISAYRNWIQQNTR